jgi:hypothetical protein
MNSEQENQLQIAQQAASILRNPLFVDAFAALEKEWTLTWRNSLPTQAAEREKVYWLLTSLDHVKAQLTRHIETGKMIAKELESEAYSRQQGDSHPDGAHTDAHV